MEDEDFLAAVEADNEGAPVVEETVAETPPAPEPVVEAPKPEPVLELTELAPEQTKPTEGFVPLGAVLDERDKRKAAEAELERIRAQQAQAQPVQKPDQWEDPEGYEAWQEARLSASIQNITLNTSERFARKEHGAETVDTAKSWALQRFTSDPLYRDQVLADPDPYERVVSDWRKDQVFKEVSDPSEFEQFKAWKAAQNQLATQPGATPTPVTASPIPPRSLAGAPSAGNMLVEPVQTDDEIFDEVIGKR